MKVIVKYHNFGKVEEMQMTLPLVTFINPMGAQYLQGQNSEILMMKVISITVKE
jgi:hypothetical protein